MERPIVVIDYGAGNLRSVARAIAHVDEPPTVSADVADIDRAAGVVLPGVGAAADTMANLEASGCVEALRRYIAQGRPFLGVCMGLQALFDRSEENDQECLGVLPGVVRRFPAYPGHKVPHMGWNTVEWVRDHPVATGIPSGTSFYFVHSFYADPAHAEDVLGTTEYGLVFPSVVARGNVVATQFHPEKSSDYGLRIYANFITWARSGVTLEPATPAGGGAS
ncbi:MAG: imidazole glycerol phosphate synthase subunit HisH [Dehalococcoidia bacterium]|nr:imidazole glycerol phosphate synthase subunit HisH [Dehalococcoidia bacterium]